MNKISYYEDCIYKIANTSALDSTIAGLSSKEKLMMNAKNNESNDDANKSGAMAGGAVRGAVTGALGTAALLGGASLLTGGKTSKVLGEMGKGGLGAFSPANISSALKNTSKFQHANAVEKGIRTLTGGKQLLQDYGTKIGVGAGIAGAGLGAMKAKSDYETAQKVRDDTKKDYGIPKSAESFEADIEKTALLGELLTAGKGLYTSFAGKSLAKKVGIGTLAGAGIGGITAKPTVDANGNAKSNFVSGALNGALMGGLTGGMISTPKTIAPTVAKGATTAATETAAGNTVAKSVVKQPKTISEVAHMNTKSIPFPKKIQPVNNAPKIIQPVKPGTSTLTDMNFNNWMPEA
jgi:hypothetical protein